MRKPPRVPDPRLGQSLRNNGTKLCGRPQCRRALGDHFLVGKQKRLGGLPPDQTVLVIQCPPDDYLRTEAE